MRFAGAAACPLQLTIRKRLGEVKMERKTYDEMYASEDCHWWFVARKLVLQKIIGQYLQNKKPSTVLEVGCGSGGNLKMLSTFGQISAMELDDEARDMANKKNLCQVKKGKLPNELPFENGFDLICILDVLEHIDDDLAALQALKAKLNQQGTLLITVPAYQFLWSAHDVASHHKRRYSKQQLMQVIAKSGLTIQYITYFNTLLFPVIAAVRIMHNILGKTTGSDVSMPSKFVNNALKTIFASERFLLPNISLPFGVSILVIAN